MSFVVYNKIDEGNFGQIYLIRKNGGVDDQKTYAMKTIKSDPDMSAAEQRRTSCNELDMLKLVRHIPFFIQLKYAFKTDRNYHFVMDYINGGNLYDFLSGGVLALAEAKVCCAEIVCALSYLHQNHIVYRDLKLENILISNDGHLLLTDFGLARTIINNKKLDDEAGTFSYFAPEMMGGSRQHSYEVDWWALGITMSELLIGRSPFLQSSIENPTEAEIRRRILYKQPDLAGLQLMNRSLECFIQALLIKDPAQRLGAGQTGFEAVKSHEFFRSLNWTAVKLKKYKCLDSNLNRSSQKITIDFSDQCQLILREKRDFYYMAPELQADDNDIDDEDEVEGSTDVDLQALSTRIILPDSIVSLDFVLANDLSIKALSMERALKTLRQLIIPRKNVRFAAEISEILNSSSTSASPSSSPSSSRSPSQPFKAKSQRKDKRFKPYTENVRRSNRILERRQSAI